jgi:ABC-2 type transport system ATP-binding protein
VMLTTHYMEEADALADRVAVLHRGRIVAEGPPHSLGGRDLAQVRIRFQLSHALAAAELPITITRKDGEIYEVDTSEEIALLRTLTNWSANSGVVVNGLTVERRSLEDVYVALTGGNDLTDATSGMGR